jgi:hypothetical protein
VVFRWHITRIQYLGLPIQITTDGLLVGAALLVLAVAGVVSGTLGIIVGVLGAILLVTGIVGFCPLYVVFGIRTRRA